MAAELVAAFVSRITILLVWKWAKWEVGEQQADAGRFPIVAGQKTAEPAAYLRAIKETE